MSVGSMSGGLSRGACGRGVRTTAWLALATAGLALPAQAGVPAEPPSRQRAPDERRSGLDFMSPALQALQRDDGQNPAMLWVQDGAALWRTPAGASGKRCADCHGETAQSLRGVAARYPAWDSLSGQPLNLAGRINQCRQRHQQAPALATEQADLLALAAYVGLQSRGLPVAPPADAMLQPLRAQGQVLWQQRLGSFAEIHDLFVLHDRVGLPESVVSREWVRELPRWDKAANLRYGLGDHPTLFGTFHWYQTTLRIVAGVLTELRGHDLSRASLLIAMAPWLRGRVSPS